MNNDALTTALWFLNTWQPTLPEAIARLEYRAAKEDHRRALISECLERVFRVTLVGAFLMFVVWLSWALVSSAEDPPHLLLVLAVLVGGLSIGAAFFMVSIARSEVGDALGIALSRHRTLARHEQLDEIQSFFDRLPRHLWPHLRQIRAVLASTDLSVCDAAKVLGLIRAVKDAEYRSAMRASLAGHLA